MSIVLFGIGSMALSSAATFLIGSQLSQSVRAYEHGRFAEFAAGSPPLASTGRGAGYQASRFRWRGFDNRLRSTVQRRDLDARR
jgi:hypothetical protein